MKREGNTHIELMIRGSYRYHCLFPARLGREEQEGSQTISKGESNESKMKVSPRSFTRIGRKHSGLVTPVNTVVLLLP